MGENQRESCYYSILTARVRYDTEISDFAKVLFSDISALCNTSGACTAQNAYFERVFGKSKSCIKRTIGLLEQRGYIRVEIVRSTAGEVEQRRIFLCTDAVENEPTPRCKNEPTPRRKNEPRGRGKNEPYRIIQDNNNIPPISPMGDGAPKAKTDKPDTGFDAFWRAYPKRVAKKAARRAWDKLSPSPEMQRTLLAALDRQRRSEDWTRDGGRYVPNASTWLNGARWEDEVKAANAPRQTDRMEEW